ncbi:multidrug efflux SMR transporter [Paenibacillus hemerocallicola]|jgi:paired small multidrug resistance pump|uniref:Multidrug efflux SMR transporter n=1 Tax=Paenibacillus hemerocallicola TaxID=1172614 RepID=A0A5C4TAW2_9BACL|nr:multidrug efflux SMR transporter [Paenibacillus hemerocallicola]TNJ66203.1 multidrug efflux SMR transporter [Paenibacillus hemerocallicola]
MDWLALVLAGCFEVVGVSGINKVNKSKTVFSYSILAFGFIVSFLCLSYAMNTISMGTAYAVWTGIGTVGSALLGMFVYGESKEWRRILFISMVLSAAVGLKLIA